MAQETASTTRKKTQGFTSVYVSQYNMKPESIWLLSYAVKSCFPMLLRTKNIIV